MRKFAVTTLTLIIMLWLGFALDGNQSEMKLAFAYCGSILWLGTFGVYFAWKVLLIMVRQLGSAVRGK